MECMRVHLHALEVGVHGEASAKKDEDEHEDDRRRHLRSACGEDKSTNCDSLS